MRKRRKIFTKETVIALSILGLLLVILLFLSVNSKIDIGLLTSETQISEFTVENESTYAFLKSNDNINPKAIHFKDVVSNPKILNQFDILWVHRIDSSDFSADEINPTVISSLSKYVNDGGKLLLSMEAFKYINYLGLEKSTPAVNYTNAADDGYGRKLGLHSFRGHPIFNGLFGGAYIFNPLVDKKCRQLGFFNESLPQSGKVIGVDWAYITLKENSKLILEYEYGKGRVIAVGAYIYLSDENRNRKHLEQFLNNTISYLTDQSYGKDPITYWEYKPSKIIPFENSSFNQNIPSSKFWETKDQTLLLSPKDGSNNYCEVAGQRMLIVGKEKGGIEEIWSHPFMALRDYEAGVQLHDSDSIIWLATIDPKVEIRPEAIIRNYQLPKATIKEVTVADITKPTAVIHYEYKGDKPAKLFIKLKTNMRQMWPYSEKAFGSIYYGCDKGLNAFTWKDESGDFATIIGSNQNPEKYELGQIKDFTWNGSELKPEKTDTFLVQGYFKFNLKTENALDLIVSSTNEKVKEAYDEYLNAIREPYKLYSDAFKYYKKLLENQLTIISPNKTFNEGYKWVLVGTDRFFVNTPGIGASLVAGYSSTAHGWDGGHKVNGRPGYAWYFGRDAEWSSFAILGYGDFDKVKSVLETFQNFQDPNGKIYHELTTSGFPHYDAADATPLYIVLAGRYLRHSGDIGFISDSWPNIKKALDYCFSTDTDGDKLIENTNVGHGWVEGGWLYGSHTTLYLASAWAAALYEAAYISSSLGYREESLKYKQEADAIKDIINNSYWNPETNYFNYGKMKDGNFNPEITIMASIPMLFGLVDTSKTLSIVKKFAQNGFSSDWGVRIVEESHRLFNPRGYHTGSVWPLYTGWAALAEYQYDLTNQGFTHLMNNLLNYKNFGLGYVDEVLNGLEYKPGGVCNHQCWSETMVLQPAIEGMLGLKPDAVNNTITIAPTFPIDWDSVKVGNIKCGSKTLSFSMKREKNKTTWSFTNVGGKQIILFKTNFPAGTNVIGTYLNGKKTIPSLYEDSRKIILSLESPISNHLKIEVQHKGGIEILPNISEPKPYDISKGFRIIDSKLQNGIFLIDVEGKPQTSHLIRVYVDGSITKVENGKIISTKDFYATIQIDFEESTEKYLTKELKLFVKFN